MEKRSLPAKQCPRTQPGEEQGLNAWHKYWGGLTVGSKKDQSRKEDKQRLRVLHIVTMNRKETARDTVLEEEDIFH